MLDHKIAFLKEQSFREARGAADVKDVLEKLKVRRAFVYPAWYRSTFSFTVSKRILWVDQQYKKKLVG